MDKPKPEGVSTGLLIKSSFWYLVASFLTKSIAFITTPIFTRILTKEEYGDFTVYANWQAILIIICGLEVYATYNLARFDFRSDEERNGYITSCLFLSTMITVVFIALYISFSDFFYNIFLVKKEYMIVMFMYFLTFPAFAMFQTKQRVEYKYKASAVVSFSTVILSAVAGVILAQYFFSDSLFGRIIGQYAFFIIFGFGFYMYFLKRSKSIRLKYIKYAVRVSIPLVFTYLASNLLLMSNNIVVKHLCNGECVSYISMAHSCINIILILMQVFNNAWSPWYYDKLDAKRYSEIQHVLSYYLRFVMFGVFCILLIAPELVYVLGGTKYMETLEIIPVYFLNAIFSAIITQCGSLETFNKKPEYGAIITGIVAVVNLALSIIGVRIWGYKAACYATLICQVLLVVLHYKVSMKMEIEQIMPKRDVLFYVVLSLTYIPFFFYVYKIDFIRVVLIIFVIVSTVIALILKRELIQRLIYSVVKK